MVRSEIFWSRVHDAFKEISGLTTAGRAASILLGVFFSYVIPKLLHFAISRRRPRAPKRLPKNLVEASDTRVSNSSSKGSAGSPGSGDRLSKHNVQRQAMLAFAQPVDHLGSVLVVPDPRFSLETTIFKTLDSVLARKLIQAKIGNRLYWDEERVAEVLSSFRALPHPVADWKLTPIVNFMEDECDFSCEHADGSFLDHLAFVRDYSAVHFRSESPRILFLHSIMGVATNCFPMTADKIPKLKNLLSPQEFKHVEAFPTVLRLLKGTNFLQDLYESTKENPTLKQFTGVRFLRVIDKAEIPMAMDDVWTHLNFHLIHALDFLPVAGWSACWNDVFLEEFFVLYLVLSRCDRLQADVRLPAQVKLVVKAVQNLGDQVLLDEEENSRLGGEDFRTQGLPDGAISKISRALPKWLMRKVTRKNVIKLSKKADVSLEYTFF